MGSVRFALAMDATAFMVFLGPPRSSLETPLGDLCAGEAIEEWERAGRSARNIAVHFRYILNPSSPDPESRSFAAEVFSRELDLMERAGLTLCCFHPGSSKGDDRLRCADLAVEALKPVFRAHSNIRIGIENMAGKGSEVGVGLVEIGRMVRGFDLPNVGLCLDTCHLWDSGFDVQDRNSLLRSVSENIGLEKLFLIHLNDSLNPRGARKDRHAPLGQGFIGFQALDGILGMRELWDVPKVLETPDPGDGSAHGAEIRRLRTGIGL